MLGFILNVIDLKVFYDKKEKKILKYEDSQIFS